MKIAGLMLLVAVAFACSELAPVSPTTLGTTSTAGTTDSRVSTQKITIFIYSDEDPVGGTYHLVGLPVTVDAQPSGGHFALQTDRQGRVKFELSQSDTLATVSTPTWNGYCGAIVPFAVHTLKSGDGFLCVHRDCEVLAN